MNKYASYPDWRRSHIPIGINGTFLTVTFNLST